MGINIWKNRLYVLLLTVWGFAHLSFSQTIHSKTRIVILSDISGTMEPDDYQSFIRFLLYSNEFDIEGIVGAGSIYGPDRGDNQYFNEVIDAYGAVRENLVKHAQGFPTVDYLKQKVTVGQQGVVGMDNVGDGKGTPGSKLIIEALLTDDPRPLWITAWGGTGTLAQALWDIKFNHSLENSEVDELISRLRVYDIAGQDNSGGWIAKTFPEIFYIRSSNQFLGMGEGHVAAAQGGNLKIADDQWFKKNIMESGAYGSIYPKRRYSYEGDTPSFLYLIQNGLSDPEKPHFGGWGGRFEREKVKNPAVRSAKVIEAAFQDFYMYNDARDSWQYADTLYNNVYAPVYRWREAYQNDLLARIQWTRSSYGEANHSPIAVVNGDQSNEVISIKTKPDKKVKLSAVDSFDPDGDELLFNWHYYQEPGTYEGEVKIDHPNLATAILNIPADATGSEIHVILELKDSGSPALFSYRRVIFDVR